MTTLQLSLSSEENKWLEDWSTLSGYPSAAEGIIEVLKVCGAIPRGSAYWQSKFGAAN